MKMRYCVVILFPVFFSCSQAKKPTENNSVNPDIGKTAWIAQWLSGWELVSRETFQLPIEKAPVFLLFDDSTVYSTSLNSVPGGQSFNGPNLLSEKLSWFSAPHNDSLHLPDGQIVPVGLMTFAGRSATGQPFFVMAAPGYWTKTGIDSKELTLKNMLSAVFLHEFAHTRQFGGMGAKADSIESIHSFDSIPLTDDIVQDFFEKDSVYTRLYHLEKDLFYAAAFAADDSTTKQLTRQALSLYRERQATYFVGKKLILRQLDDIFLSMEGLGQFTGLSWLLDPKGGNIPFADAVKGFRRKGGSWSQEQGLAMFLVLNKISQPDWHKDVFGPGSRTIAALLEEVSARQD